MKICSLFCISIVAKLKKMYVCKKTFAMKKTILSISVCLLSMYSFSQQQLENATFELWENVGAPTVEPEEWSSLKTADALASSAPTVISRDNGRPDAGYCLKLETKSVFGIAANGIATNGRVHADFNPENGYVFTDQTNADWHTVFTSRPDSLASSATPLISSFRDSSSVNSLTNLAIASFSCMINPFQLDEVHRQ